MKMFPITNEILDNTAKQLGIADVSTATIRQICSLSAALEEAVGQKFVHLELGNPGLPPNKIGVEAELEALASGVAGIYPNIAGIPQFKTNASRFIKAFLDTDIPGRCIVPTIGSMQGSFACMELLHMRDPKKDTMLFINPGFPVQTNQAKIIGLNIATFDIFNHRGPELEKKLEEVLSKGNVSGMIYSNPNNPAWTNLTDEELRIIGRMATKHDVIVLEDLAYLGMDFRKYFGRPCEAPFIPTVAKYTDNYVLLISASKIFSYAGQRIGMSAISPALFDRPFEALKQKFNMPQFGNAFIYGILYALSSGTAHSAQHAMARMLGAAADGALDFVEECRAYEIAGNRAKKIFLDNGFHLVYDKDGDAPISDGFFFTVGYGDMSSSDLQRELMRYGISAINLASTGSEQKGLRVCISMLDAPETFEALEKRVKSFRNDH